MRLGRIKLFPDGAGGIVCIRRADLDTWLMERTIARGEPRT
jgi:hypothetical protein